MKPDATDHTGHDNGIVAAPVRTDDHWESGPREPHAARARRRFATRPATNDEDRIEAAAIHEFPESWQAIKSRFVDDPAAALHAAEAMVQRMIDERIRLLRAEAAAVCSGARGEGATDAFARRPHRSTRRRVRRRARSCRPNVCALG